MKIIKLFTFDVLQASTGSGGWPLSIFLTPDLYPVYGGTYFPPEGHYGRPGFSELLKAIAGSWRESQVQIYLFQQYIYYTLDNSHKIAG